MMIETKGTKASQAADGAKRYVLQAAKAKSGAPYYVAFAVAALAAYLKSLFQDSAQAVGQVEVDPSQPKIGPKFSVVPSTAEEAGVKDREERLMGTSGTVTQSEALASQYDSPQYLQTRALQFANPDPGTNLNDFKASPVIPMPTNDNGGKASGGGGGGGGAGDRGSGEKEAEKQTPPKAGDGTSGSGGEKDGPSEGKPPTNPGLDPGGRPSDGDGGDAIPGRLPTGDGGDEPGGRRNRAPVASGPVRLSDVTGCALLPIALSDLLRNVEDPDGDRLSVSNVTISSGTLVRSGDGWAFDGDAIGPVTITYQVTDGEFSITHTAVLNVVERNQMVGTEGDDIILGTLCDDEIDGRNGNDNIDARAGANVVNGGAGDDHIVGGTGDDVILGGAGDDVVFAGTGADHVSGGVGNDRLFGEEGDDVLFGDAGDDLLDGGGGSDFLLGGLGSDTLLGEAGEDRIDGGDGNDFAFGGLGRDVVSGGADDDRLEGGEGDDVLSDGAGRDVAMGQEGNDVLVAALDGEGDRFDGGVGDDLLDLSRTTLGVAVDLATGTSAGDETGQDWLVLIEDVRGGTGDDTILGNFATNEISGGAGRDHISGEAGNDRLDGGGGDDTLLDGTGSDVALGGAGDDVIVAFSDGEGDFFDGGTGEDTLNLSGTRSGVVADLLLGTMSGAETGQDQLAALEVLIGGSGGDTLLGSHAADRLSGGGGDDRISGRAGDDDLDGGAGRDTLDDGAGRDNVQGGAGDDLIRLALDGENDSVSGGEGCDTLDLSDATQDLLVDLVSQVVFGSESGDDQVDSIERFVSGSGNDRFIVGDHDVVITGGDGNDVYEFGSNHGSGNAEFTRAVQVTDFSVGDYVSVLNYMMFEEGFGGLGQSLTEAMARNDGTLAGIQYHSARMNDSDVTVITADLDSDDTFESIFILDGQHTLLFVEVERSAAQSATNAT